MMYAVNLVPAYGRDYKTPAEVLQDWNNGKDFLIADVGNKWNDRFTSIRDWDDPVRIRYDRLGEFVIIAQGKIVG